jgi:hypothetical protein
MKKTVLSILTICMFVSYGLKSAAQHTDAKKVIPATAFKGTWVEFWSYDKKSDVKYNDTFRISINNGKPEISSVGPHIYNFSQVRLSGRLLTFTLINESYFLPYRLQLNKNEATLYGTARSISKNLVRIKWQKIPD